MSIDMNCDNIKRLANSHASTKALAQDGITRPQRNRFLLQRPAQQRYVYTLLAAARLNAMADREYA